MLLKRPPVEKLQHRDTILGGVVYHDPLKFGNPSCQRATNRDASACSRAFPAQAAPRSFPNCRSTPIATWTANWLPADPNRKFELMFRLYASTEALMRKEWNRPTLIKCGDRSRVQVPINALLGHVESTENQMSGTTYQDLAVH
jgi:hypothetical protein